MARSLGRKGLLIAAVSLGAFVLPAAAQFGTRPQDQQQVISPRPPTPRTADRPPTLWMYLLAVVLGGAVVGAALIPSKRGHQD